MTSWFYSFSILLYCRAFHENAHWFIGVEFFYCVPHQDVCSGFVKHNAAENMLCFNAEKMPVLILILPRLRSNAESAGWQFFMEYVSFSSLVRLLYARPSVAYLGGALCDGPRPFLRIGFICSAGIDLMPLPCQHSHMQSVVMTFVTCEDVNLKVVGRRSATLQ